MLNKESATCRLTIEIVAELKKLLLLTFSQSDSMMDTYIQNAEQTDGIDRASATNHRNDYPSVSQNTYNEADQLKTGSTYA
jgi:hypothetical protein